MLRVLAASSVAAVALAVPDADAYDYTQHPDVSIIDLGDGKYSGGGMTLQMMPDKGLAGMGAVCLDGSDAGFYFSPSTGGDKYKDSWQLYFQGGGWYVCMAEQAAPPKKLEECPAFSASSRSSRLHTRPHPPGDFAQVLRRDGLLRSVQGRARLLQDLGEDLLDGRHHVLRLQVQPGAQLPRLVRCAPVRVARSAQLL